MDAPRSSHPSPAQRRYDAWRADAFQGLVAHEARERKDARRLRRAIKIGAGISLVLGLSELIVQLL